MGKIRFALVSVVCAFALVVVGCATARINLVQDGTVKVETVSSEDGAVESVNVHQHNGTMEIEIMVRPTERVRSFVAGAVEVEIQDPEGASFSFVQKRAIKQKMSQFSTLQHAHFWVLLPYKPGPGTLIRVTHISTDEGPGIEAGEAK